MADDVRVGPGVGSMVGASSRWHHYLRFQYRLIRLLDPAARFLWHAGALGITGELEVVGRRTGRPRRVLLGVLRIGGRRYVGHPDGSVGWTANLASSGAGHLTMPGQAPVAVTATRLATGPERTAVILATARQQPFPGNVVYRLARRHILAVGTYFRLDPAMVPVAGGTPGGGPDAVDARAGD